MIPKKFTEPFFILCEGAADEAFLRYLLEVRGIAHSFQIGSPGGNYGFGNSAFGAALDGSTLVPGFQDVKAILVLTDCDEDPDAAFKFVREQITEQTSFNAPRALLEIVETIDLPKLVVGMIPFDNVCGNLESYIVRAMEQTWGDVKISADRHLADTPAAVWRHCKQSKSIMQCMIAVLHLEDPNKSLAWIWSDNEEFRDMLRHPTFDGLSEYLTEFPKLFIEPHEDD